MRFRNRDRKEENEGRNRDQAKVHYYKALVEAAVGLSVRERPGTSVTLGTARSRLAVACNKVSESKVSSACKVSAKKRVNMVVSVISKGFKEMFTITHLEHDGRSYGRSYEQ